MKKRVDTHPYGLLLIMIGLITAFPLTMLIFYPQDIPYAWAFIVPASVTGVAGLIITFYAPLSKIPKSHQEIMELGSITVLFTWCAGFLVGALPFWLAGRLTFCQALFDSVSAYTTTGLSTLDVSITPHIFLFARGFMQFCGGLGFVMLMTTFFRGQQSMTLFSSEGHPDKVAPNLGATARAICLVYVVFLIVGTLLYRICGMPVFDGVVHTMCALSTGGFSNKLDSIGAYNSVSIEAVTIGLMLIGTTNFAVLLLLVRGKIQAFFKVSEVRFMFLVIAVAVPVIAFSLVRGLSMTLGGGLRSSLFNVVSALSTTGYATCSYAHWPALALGGMIVLMLIGGGIGSTAGGIKLIRIYLMFRYLGDYIFHQVSNKRRVTQPRYQTVLGATPINRELIGNTVGFITCYLILFMIGTLAVTVTANCSLTQAAFDFASSLGTVGLSIGITGPDTNNATLIVEMLGMLLGRLEIFIVFVGCYSGFTRIKKAFKKRIPVKTSTL
ncbi:MAG: potassium transporter TrkG [Eubacteriaceae bacterium]|nr:potassium transporter TrkG [Eubacteriaceae bacterium]